MLIDSLNHVQLNKTPGKYGIFSALQTSENIEKMYSNQKMSNNYSKIANTRISW